MPVSFFKCLLRDTQEKNISLAHKSLLNSNYVLWCDSVLVEVWLGLGIQITLFGLGKDYALG